MPFLAHRIFEWKPVVIDESWGLSTIPMGSAYTICNSLYCPNCVFLFLDMRFDDSELQKLYNDYRGEEYTRVRDIYEPGYAKRNSSLNVQNIYIDSVENYLSPYLKRSPAVLDWGGDTGINTPFLKSCKRLDIYEISGKEVVAGARSVTLDAAKREQYDLVVCCQVLEHVSFPLKVLDLMRSCMKPGTFLYLELPHEDIMRHGIGGSGKKRHWHEHINFYSVKSVDKLLESFGLDVVRIDSAAIPHEGKTKYHLRCIARA
jgi:SAM-dependent methyltransferase